MYEGLPIATNKPTAEDLALVPHHMVSFLGADDLTFDVRSFEKKAREVVQKVRVAGKVPILVGGTAYFVARVVMAGNGGDDEDRGDGDGGAHDGDEAAAVANAANKAHAQAAAAESSEHATAKGSPEVPREYTFEALERIDPDMAKRWHPNDLQRIRTSLEVFYNTGKKHSEHIKVHRQQKIPYYTKVFLFFVLSFSILKSKE
jgi:tRNA dimethylallyltransferase